MSQLLKLNLPSASNAIGNSQKRKLDKISPDISEQHKKYLYETDTLVKQNKYYLPENSQNELNTDLASNDTEATKIKIPPIYIHNANNYRTVSDDIRKTIESENFTIQCKTNSMKVMLTNPNDFRKLTKYYDEHEIQYHTFQLPDNALLSVVIRNIPISVTDDEIKTELSKQFTVKRVTRLLNKEKLPIPLCAVDIERNETSDGIFNITRYLHSIISVEPRRKSNDIPQCTRCQRYGHTKNYCKLEPRCVKCLQNHHYTQCSKRQGEKPSCVNCQGDHTANYRGCPYYVDLKTKIGYQQRQNKRTEVNPVSSQHANEHFSPRRVIPSSNTNTRSYAQAVKSDQDTISNLLKILTDFISPYMDQIKEFISSVFTSLFSSFIQSK